MTQSISMTSRISGVAMLALAALPFAALATSAHASSVKVSDLNPITIEGQATFAQRADVAVREHCSSERMLTAVRACRAGARAELNQKFEALRVAALAQQKSFAAR